MMKTNRKSKSTHVFALFGLVLSSLLLSCPTYGQSEIGVMEFPEGAVQHTVYANDIQWNPCPGNLPEGCNIAVLEGSPQQPDLFTVRFKMDGSFYMPPHRHPKDERVTILEGKAYVAFGEGVTRKQAKAFGPGDYYVNKREAVHQVWADQGTILQITGIGPWEVHFLDE